MNHENAHAQADSMLHVCRRDVAVEPHDTFFEKDGEVSLPFILETCAMAHAQWELVAILKTLVEQTEPLLPPMEEGLDRLKEGFLARLRTVLTEGGIDENTRLVFGLDESGRLQVVDRSLPLAETLDTLLENETELQAGLQEIAAQSQVLRGLHTLSLALEDSNESLGESFQGGAYHVCLKGALSHFYFPVR